ncbi:MAG: hypothetical protein U0792_07745 [Gemmataceae bacterium]
MCPTGGSRSGIQGDPWPGRLGDATLDKPGNEGGCGGGLRRMGVGTAPGATAPTSEKRLVEIDREWKVVESKEVPADDKTITT